MPAPDNVTVEVEFTAGTWTDISQWVDFSQQFTITMGRTTPFSPPQPGRLSGLTLNNTDGRFSPFRQVLADGVTAHPYYPNVLPHVRIRVAYVISGASYYRFTGYVIGWAPSLIDTYKPRVVIEATTQDDTLAKVYMQPPIAQVMGSLAPDRYWPLTDPANSTAGLGSSAATTSALEVSGNNGPSLTMVDSGALPTFGADGINTDPEDGTCVSFAPNSATSGKYLRASGNSKDTSSDITFVWWYNAGTTTNTSGNENMFGAECGVGFWVQMLNTGFLKVNQDGDVLALVDTASTLDGGWHMVAVRITGNGTTWELYREGSVQATATGTPVTSLHMPSVTIGEAPNADALLHYQGRIAQVSVFQRALSDDELGTLYWAGWAWAGEMVDARIKRYLGYAGLTSADWNVDTSSVQCGSAPQSGKDVATACQDLAITEGGGSTFYFGPDGKAQFSSRMFRKPSDPVLIVDAEADLDGTNFVPAYDDMLVINQEQASRGTVDATASTQVVNDTDSQTMYGLISEQFTSYANSDSDVLFNAQDRLVQQANPAFRLGSLTVDLWTSQTAGIWASVANALIGSRIRVTGLDGTIAPASQLDLIVEGWTDTVSNAGYVVAYDTSPADNPARMIWGENLVSNPSFETDTSGWMASNATVTRDTSQHEDGAASGKFVSNASGTPFMNSGDLTVTPSTTYKYSAWVYVPANLSQTYNALVVEFYTDFTSFTFISDIGYGLHNLSAATSGWTYVEQTFTTPANCTGIIAYVPIASGTSAAADTIYVDQVAIVKQDLLAYKVWGTDGQTLAASMTNSQTTMQISSPAGQPTFTVDPSAYPLTVQVGSEHIELTGVPNQSTSPQTFSGITRGVDGTTAAAHASADTVDLVPAPAWTL